MSKSSDHGSNMMIIKSSLMGQPNFSLIPVSIDCPFVEAIFDPGSKNLVVFNKCVQSKFRMLPKVDENGDTMTPKKLRPNKERIMEERKQMESFTEHYIAELSDVKAFVNFFAINPEVLDIEPFLKKAEPALEKV